MPETYSLISLHHFRVILILKLSFAVFYIQPTSEALKKLDENSNNIISSIYRNSQKNATSKSPEISRKSSHFPIPRTASKKCPLPNLQKFYPKIPNLQRVPRVVADLSREAKTHFCLFPLLVIKET